MDDPADLHVLAEVPLERVGARTEADVVVGGQSVADVVQRHLLGTCDVEI